MDVSEGVIGCLPIQLEAVHKAELERLIEELPKINIYNGQPANDLNFERFTKLVQLYSEEPQLLDPALQGFVSSLLKFVQWPSENLLNSKFHSHQPFSTLSLAALNRLQVLTRIRGYKIMIRLLPHEVGYLKKLLYCLECYANETDLSKIQSNARVTFLLTAWLLIICKNPFNLIKFDMATSGLSVEIPVADRITDCMCRLLQRYIPQGEMSIVSTLLAQILTRDNDNMVSLMPHINAIVVVIKKFDSETNGGRKLISSLRLLIALFKWGKRKEMKICAQQLIDSIMEKILNVNCLNIEVRNLTVKLVQRIALVLLKPRLANWRYKCGYRSLEESFKGIENLLDKKESSQPKSSEQSKDDTDNDDDDADVAYEVIEKFIDELLRKINDRDNVVRWTAAKGIARICARLNRELAAEVVAAVVNSGFDTAQTGGIWHGGCLALAELCRRGCLLPEQVPQVASKILPNAFIFEQSLIGLAVAVSVRDAACYICWSFARAYESQILKSCLEPLAYDIVCLALFDREVNIRRAASAAFQENVGRNNCFVHGIHILHIIDYSEVALIRNCYLNLSVQVAKFEEYRRPMLNHLIEHKTKHWDETLRELASESLQQLVGFDCDYSYETILPKLCTQLSNKDSAIRHGTLCAISGFLTGLLNANCLKQDELKRHWPILLTFVHENVKSVDNHRVKGYTQLAKGFCRFIQALCAIGAPLSDAQLTEFHDILDVIIADQNERLHSYAANAFETLMNCYVNDRFQLLLHRLVHKYFTKIQNSNGIDELTRSSCIVPLAHISSFLLSNEITYNLPHQNNICRNNAGGSPVTLAELILRQLLDVIYDELTPKWVYARVAAIKCISEIACKFVPDNFDFALAIECLNYASDDSTITVNGDIGRFTRKAAVHALVELLPLAHTKYGIKDPELIAVSIGKIIQRCCASIDDLRSTSCLALCSLLQTAKDLPIIDRELLENIFIVKPCKCNGNPKCPNSADHFSEVDWTFSRGFMRLQALLSSSTYRLSAMEGFILSSGSIAEWTSQNAYAAVAFYMKGIKKDAAQLKLFIQDFMKIYYQIGQRKCDVSPVLSLFRMLLNDRIFAIFENNPDQCQPLVDLTNKMIQIALGRGKPKMKCLAISVLGGFLQFNSKSKLYNNCASVIISFLESPYPSLREVAVEQLFEALNSMQDLSINNEDGNSAKSQHADIVFHLLTQTPWTETNKTELILKAKQRISSFFLPK